MECVSAILDEVYELMGKAKSNIFPSQWYETFGRVAVEAAKVPSNYRNLGWLLKVVESECWANCLSLRSAARWSGRQPHRCLPGLPEARAELTNYTMSNYQMLMEFERVGTAKAPPPTGRKRFLFSWILATLGIDCRSSQCN